MPFREPVIDLLQSDPRLIMFALFLPEAGEANHDAQFPRFCPLPASNADGLLKIGFRQILFPVLGGSTAAHCPVRQPHHGS